MGKNLYENRNKKYINIFSIQNAINVKIKEDLSKIERPSFSHLHAGGQIDLIY